MTPRDLALLDGYLAGTLSPADFASVQSLLRRDANARRALRDLATVETKLEALAAGNPLTQALLAPAPIRAPQSVEDSRPTWLPRRPVSLAVAGMLVGLCCASAVWAMTLPSVLWSRGLPLPLVDGGFEGGDGPGDDGVPTRAGVWGGDFAERSRGHGGIVPREGAGMLRFLRAANRQTPEAASPVAAQMWQVVDVETVRDLVGRGPVTIEVAAHFNTAESAAAGTTGFGVSVSAFEGDEADAPAWHAQRSLALARAEKEELADGDPAAWQRIATQVVVPPEANLLLVEIRVMRKGKTPSAAEFDCHFCDAVTLRALPPRSGIRSR